MISPDFVFSQNSLQDFLECPRKFQLRHLLRMAWPSAETDDQAAYEHHQEQGLFFHLKVQQYYSGIPGDVITESIQDEMLKTWWDHFLISAAGFPWAHLLDVPGSGLTLHPEFTLSARIGDHRLIAKYDLIAVLPGSRFWIYDWKTSLSVPPVEKMEQRVQTRLYSWMLAQAGAHLNQGVSIPPEQVILTYWFAQMPGKILVFPYTAEQYADDERNLSNLMEYIAHLGDEDFLLSEDLRQCRFCTYRSYCERSFAPGNSSDLEEDDDSFSIPSWDDIDTLEL